ncbi:MAG: DUF1996 domain-containing protein [Actinomycetota bacterium]|nr:DUF1996 domain-containing protein [Actinomycetota bacterium]
MQRTRSGRPPGGAVGLALVLSCAAALLGGAAPAQAARWDVSLGGSLAAESPSPGRGFVARLYERLAGAGDLALRDLACRGATSASMAGSRTCRGTAGSQAGNGEAFLRSQRGQVAVVTVELGASEIFACVHAGGADRACLRRTLRSIDRGLPGMLAHWHAAAGAQARFLGMTYYDPFRGRAGRRGGHAAVRALNRHLRSIYRRSGVQSVSLGAAFAGRRLCRRTGACRRRFDPRPNAAGAQAIADAFAAAIGPLPRSGVGQEGQFITPCRYSHRAPDDPIVYPNQAGRSHSHDFFGNGSTSSTSTLESLKAAPTSCRRLQDRAAYWVPTLLYDGQPVTPRSATIYYRDAGKDPAAMRPFPAGLRLIAGDSKATGPQSLDVMSWGCGSESGIERQQAPPVCPAGRSLVGTVRFPDCWDGVNLDSPDHKSHLAYAIKVRGGRACPGSHPVAVPKITFNVRYPVPGGPSVSLASGSAFTEHADFFNAWDPPTLASLVMGCLVADVKCGSS